MLTAGESQQPCLHTILVAVLLPMLVTPIRIFDKIRGGVKTHSKDQPNARYVSGSTYYSISENQGTSFLSCWLTLHDALSRLVSSWFVLCGLQLTTPTHAYDCQQTWLQLVYTMSLSNIIYAKCDMYINICCKILICWKCLRNKWSRTKQDKTMRHPHKMVSLGFEKYCSITGISLQNTHKICLIARPWGWRNGVFVSSKYGAYLRFSFSYFVWFILLWWTVF